MRRLLVLALLPSLLVHEAGATGVIRGTIWPTRGDAHRAELAHQSEAANRPVHHGFFDFLFRAPAVEAQHTAFPSNSAPQLRPQPGVLDAVITLREVPESVEQRLAQRDHARGHSRVAIRESRYWPRVMAVPAGTDLEFQNLDPIWHSTFSVSAASRFDLGKLKPGTIDTVRLVRPGVINLHCDIHPDEIGFVVVAPNHAFTRPDSLGRFTLPKLPAGSYQIEIWHPLRGDRVAQIVVPKRGDVTCDLAF